MCLVFLQKGCRWILEEPRGSCDPHSKPDYCGSGRERQQDGWSSLGVVLLSATRGRQKHRVSDVSPRPREGVSSREVSKAALTSLFIHFLFSEHSNMAHIYMYGKSGLTICFQGECKSLSRTGTRLPLKTATVLLFVLF